VTAAGGLGMLGGALAGVEALTAALQEVRRQASGPVGVNFVEPFFDRESHRSVLEAAAEHGDLVEFFYGEPDAELLAIVHEGGALAGWQVGSVDEGRRAEACGADVIAVQGVEAGGHVRGTRALLPLLADTLERVTVPVVAAGGISSPRAMAAVLAAGAGGARLGTRFVASVESDFHDRYKEALVAADGSDTVYTDRFGELWPGAPHRVLRSAIEAAEAAAPAAVVGEMSAGSERIEVPRFAGFAPVADATGAVEAMALFAGEGVGAIREILPAGEIVRRFVAETASLLGALAQELDRAMDEQA
jgi:nitronate monooxygenase